MADQDSPAFRAVDGPIRLRQGLVMLLGGRPIGGSTSLADQGPFAIRTVDHARSFKRLAPEPIWCTRITLIETTVVAVGCAGPAPADSGLDLNFLLGLQAATDLADRLAEPMGILDQGQAKEAFARSRRNHGRG